MAAYLEADEDAVMWEQFEYLMNNREDERFQELRALLLELFEE